MSQKYKRLLDSILHQPVSSNIHWREVESLLEHLGAEISPGHGARMHVELNGVHGTLHRPHHGSICEKHDIRHIRDYLVQAGVHT